MTSRKHKEEIGAEEEQLQFGLCQEESTETNHKKEIKYFTDGSASPNPGPGGFAVIKNGAPYLIGGEFEDSEVFHKTSSCATLSDGESVREDTRDDGLAERRKEVVFEKPVKTTTNIRMEGLAIMAALNDADGEQCEITTDSEFWINVLTKWAPTWKKNGWQKKGGVKNLDIVKPLFELFQNSRASLIWTRGHVGTELNELADEWANQARRMKVVGVKKVKDI